MPSRSEILRGTEVEMEHTDDPVIARQIAMDHLEEDPHYYSKLARCMTENPKKTAYEAMAWSSDPLVRDIYSELDDRELPEIAEGLMEVFYGTEDDPHDREFQEPSSNSHLTREEAFEALLLASTIVGWANYGVHYGDYDNPPWERRLPTRSLTRVHVPKLSPKEPNPVENPPGLTAKGHRMYEHIKESTEGPRAKSIAAATVYARASGGVPGLVTDEWAEEHGYPRGRRTRPPGVRARENPFMVPQYAEGDFACGEVDGEPVNVPWEHRDVVEWDERPDKVSGFWAHLSAPGYLDQTDWSGPFDTFEEAQDFIEEQYDVDPETGEELDEDE